MNKALVAAGVIGILSVTSACTPSQPFSGLPKHALMEQEWNYLVRFEPGHSHLSGAGERALREALHGVPVTMVHRVLLPEAKAMPGSGSQEARLYKRRVHSVEKALVDAGVPKGRIMHRPLRDDEGMQHIAVDIEYHLASSLPECHDWSFRSAYSYAYTPYSRFGCAQVNNLVKMQQDPGVLKDAYATAPMDPNSAVNAVDAYRNPESGDSGEGEGDGIEALLGGSGS